MGEIVKPEFFKEWKAMLDFDIGTAYLAFQQKELDAQIINFNTLSSAISSSNIEGELMEFIHIVKHKSWRIELINELSEKPNDLYQAYLFAKDNSLTFDNLQNANKIISAHLFRQKPLDILQHAEKLINENDIVGSIYKSAIKKYSIYINEFLWHDIEMLLNKELSIEEVFYYAAYIHLEYTNINVFEDESGTKGRLLEKWFLVGKLGASAWNIPTEKYYYLNLETFKNNISQNNNTIKKSEKDKTIPFLLMLPQALAFDK